MTEREKSRQLAKAAKLSPKPTLTPAGKWRCQVRIGDSRQSFTANTPEEAHAMAVAAKAGYIQKTKVPDNMTLEQACERYIESNGPVLSPATIRGYNKIKRANLNELRNVRLSDLTQERVQRWVSNLSKDHAAKTVKNAHGFLTAVLGVYLPSLVLKTKLPQADAKEIVIPTEEELRLIFEDCKGKEAELPILLAVWMGLRESEIRGLKWTDIKDGRLHVCRATVDGETTDGTAVVATKKTKTVAGDRWIKIPDYIMEVLERTPRNTENIVNLSGAAIYMRFTRMCDRLGIPRYRFHDLRHTAASVAVLAGVPTKYSKERMGHATDNMLKTVYEHVMRGKEDGYAERIDEYFECITSAKMSL